MEGEGPEQSGRGSGKRERKEDGNEIIMSAERKYGREEYIERNSVERERA